MKRGLVIGKFLPLHLGHEYLLNRALSHVDELSVIIVVKQSDPYSYCMRESWFKELYGKNVNVIPLDDQLPVDGGFKAADRKKWIEAIKMKVTDIDLVISSESYIYELCDALEAKAMVVDEQRISIPISGSLIRTEPKKYRKYMSEAVSKDVIK